MRGLRLFIVALFGLSVALAGCDSRPPEPTVDPGITAALAPVCSGHAVSGTGSLETSGAPNHLVLLNSDGATFDLSNRLPGAWSPPSLSDAELVACTPDEPVMTVLEVCPYIGSDVTRYAEQRDVTVVEAATGAIAASFTISAEPRHCSPTENADLTVLEGSIDTSLVISYLSGLVETGRYVAPGASPDPGQSPGPGKTSEPSANARVAELRQALADQMVSVSSTGDGLQSLDIELTSEVGFDLDVTIDVGTQLEPGARGTQRMVVTNGQTVSLGAGETVSATLDVACIEMHQDQPTGADTFTVLDEPATADLYQLLASPDFTDLTGRVQQFAVWTITNNPKRNDFVGLRSGFDVFGSGPDDDEIAAIRDIFETAGIEVSSYRALK